MDGFDNIGLRYQRDAPNDPRRGWESTVSMAVAGQISVPLRFPNLNNDQFVPLIAGNTYSVGLNNGAVQAFLAPGILAPVVAGPNTGEIHFLTFTGGGFALQRRINGTPNQFMSVGGPLSRQAWAWNQPIHRQAGGSIWVGLAALGGLIDIMQAYAQTVVNAGIQYWCNIVLGDVLFIFRPATAVAPYGIIAEVARPFSPTITPILSQGAAVFQTIPNEFMMTAPIVYQGLIYFATDRALYSVMWDDDRKRILINQVVVEDRITSNVVAWNGSIYYACGNQVKTYNPARPAAPGIDLDPNLGMRPPFNADIVWMASLPNGLYCATQPSQVNRNVALDSDFSMMLYKLTTNLAWQSVRYIHRTLDGVGIAGTANGAPAVFYDSTAPHNFSYISIAGASSLAMKMIPIGAGTAINPEFLEATYRQQEAKSRFWLTPLIDGRNPLLPKKLERFEGRVSDVSVPYPIRLWKQKDEDVYAADTFSASVNPEMVGTGAWTLALTINDTRSDLSGYGTGLAHGITTEVLTTLDDWQTMRWAIEIFGDPTGQTMPRFYGMKMRFLELPDKFYVWQLPIELRTESNRLESDQTPQDAEEIYAHHSILANLANMRPRPIVTMTLPTGDVREGIFSKFEGTLEQFNEESDRDPTAGVNDTSKVLYNLSFEEIRPAQANVRDVIG
jgi:hypothetical protein